jgi:flagellar protein FlaG
MDINRITGNGQSSVITTQQTSRTEAPQTQKTVAAPVLPDNGLRVPAAGTAQSAESQAANLKQAIDAINRFLQPVSGDIEFSVDEDSGRTLVKIVDTKTNTVLRQYPSEQVLAIAKELDKLQGLLVKDKV